LPPASPAQRAKVAGLRCLVCGIATRIDPAHLVPRSLGGCDAADCVVPLCRAHHRAYDQGRLDLVAHLEPHWRPEVAHAVCHLGLVRTLRRLSGRRSVGGDNER
jgi:predicted restriction endonuclease